MRFERRCRRKGIYTSHARRQFEAWHDNVLVTCASALGGNNRRIISLCNFIYHSYETFVPAVLVIGWFRGAGIPISGISNARVGETWLSIGNAGEIERQFERGDEDVQRRERLNSSHTFESFCRKV